MTNGIIALLRATGIPLRDAHEWHTLSAADAEHQGEINGIPSLRGRLVAANGGLAIMMRGTEPCLVHLHFFISDKRSAQGGATAPSVLTAPGKAARLDAMALWKRYDCDTMNLSPVHD